jgi:hypothetical protein
MPKVRFCPECQNNFSNYSYVTEKVGNKPVNYLVYTCQACLHTERVEAISDLSEGLLFSKTNLNQLPDKEINPDMCLDPTLPHTVKVECPNKDCATNKSSKPTPRNVVFFHYNTEMKLAYICCVCRSFWKVK